VKVTGPVAPPDELLGTCLRLELEAADLYRRFQGAATEPALVELWETMARGESEHAHFIERLVHRRQFVVPAVSRATLTALVERVDAIRSQADVGALSADRMLSISAALEFSEMDDLFTVLCQSSGLLPDEGRLDHLGPLIHAVSEREDGDHVLRHLLAAMLRQRRRAGSVPSLLNGFGLGAAPREH